MTRLLIRSHAGWGKAKLLRFLRHRAKIPNIGPLSLKNISRLEHVARKHGPPARAEQLPLFGVKDA